MFWVSLGADLNAPYIIKSDNTAEVLSSEAIAACKDELYAAVYKYLVHDIARYGIEGLLNAAIDAGAIPGALDCNKHSINYALSANNNHALKVALLHGVPIFPADREDTLLQTLKAKDFFKVKNLLKENIYVSDNANAFCLQVLAIMLTFRQGLYQQDLWLQMEKKEPLESLKALPKPTKFTSFKDRNFLQTPILSTLAHQAIKHYEDCNVLEWLESLGAPLNNEDPRSPRFTPMELATALEKTTHLSFLIRKLSCIFTTPFAKAKADP